MEPDRSTKVQKPHPQPSPKGGESRGGKIKEFFDIMFGLYDYFYKILLIF